MSERIIDCPAKVMVIGADCDHAAGAFAHTSANKIARLPALAENRTAFKLVSI